MSWDDAIIFDGPPLLFRTRSAVVKLLERVKGEEPSIYVVSKPSEPVVSRKSRFKFPDPTKDCSVNLKVSSHNGELCLPVCYESQEDSDHHICGGLRYILQVLSVKRLTLDGKHFIANECQEDFYCCSPLSAHKKGSAKKSLGFWFRFLGKDATFRVTVALKLDVVSVKNLIGRRHLSDSLFSDDGIVSSEEFEISTRVKSSQSTAAAERDEVINAAKIFPSLYLNKEYKSIVTRFKDLRHELNFKELDKFFVQTLEGLSDNDLKVVLFLEQSQEACRKRLYEKSKQLLKQAVDAAAKCKNKTLLMGRAYLYLSYVHEKDGYLGNAEECLAIARKKLQALEACEDIGDLCFQEGLILTNFAQKMPKFALKLIGEAIHKFEQAAALFSNGLTVDNALDKLCSSYIRLASLLLKQKPPILGTDGSYVQPTCNIALANKHLEWVTGHLAELSERTKFNFHVCHTELLYEKREYEKARESLGTAFQIANACQFEEQAMWKELPASSSCNESYLQQTASYEQPADGKGMDVFAVEDVPLGYLGDISS